MYIIYALLIMLAWMFIGCSVLASIDDEQESLRSWAREFSTGLVICAWPIVTFFWFYKRPKKEPK